MIPMIMGCCAQGAVGEQPFPEDYTEITIVVSAVDGIRNMISIGVDGPSAIDWGDGSPPEFTDWTDGGHLYEAIGEYKVRLYAAPGGNPGMTGNHTIVSVDSWQSDLDTLRFSSCNNLTSVPPYIPTTVTRLSFIECPSLNDPNISLWDVSNITDMTQMFTSCSAFNQDISGWDVSNVTNMTQMFAGASSFNQDLSGWCVSNITSEPTFFDDGATAWVHPRPVWGTCGGVTEFVVGHAGTLYVRNNDGGSELTVDWGDGSPVETTYSSLTHTYPNATFTGRAYKSSGGLVISGTPLTSISSIQHGLSRIYFYEQGMSSINLASVPSSIPSSITSMDYMFVDATSFNGDISAWDVSNVTSMEYMFSGATSFNGDISAWDVSSVTNMSHMFTLATSFNGDISSWNVSNVTDMQGMFRNASAFNSDLSAWDVGNVTIMQDMFRNAISFNSDISSWDVSSAIDTQTMFYNATAFNSNLSSWDVSSVTNMGYMFYYATSFNSDLSGWCVSNITSKPTGFDDSATSWTLPRPVWGTCPNG